MYLEFERGKHKKTQARCSWLIGQPTRTERMMLWWMAPESESQKFWQGQVALNLGPITLGLTALAINAWVHSLALFTFQALMLILQSSFFFANDLGKRRSWLTVLVERRLRKSRLVTIESSRALLALSQPKEDFYLGWTCKELKEHPELKEAIDAYLLDPEVTEWANLLELTPVDANIEDKQIARSIETLLNDRAKAVLNGSWPVKETPALAPVNPEAAEAWRLRATAALSEDEATQWHQAPK